MWAKKDILYLLVPTCLLAACSSANVREAQSVVQQADSLWHEGKMYGVDEGDSIPLAQAYETLGKHAFVYRTPFLRTYSLPVIITAVCSARKMTLLLPCRHSSPLPVPAGQTAYHAGLWTLM